MCRRAVASNAGLQRNAAGYSSLPSPRIRTGHYYIVEQFALRTFPVAERADRLIGSWTLSAAIHGILILCIRNDAPDENEH